MPQISLECLRAADTSLKTAPLTHHTLTSKPAGASLHSHNASVPPPPTLPAAVTEDPDHPTQGHHQEDSIQQAPEPLQEPLLHIHNRPSGQKTPEGSETKPSKAESTMLPRKKPPVPPKPAHLSQIHPPQRLPKPLAGSARASEAGQDHKPGEPGIANPGSDKAPTIAGQDCLPLAESSKGQKQPAHQRPLSSMASRPSRGQITSSNSQSPESPKLNVLNNDSSPPQKHNSSPQKQGTPESPQGSHQELQGLLSQVQTLEKEASRSVDVQALRKLFEGVPQLGGGVPQAPTAPHMTEASMEQAFGELTRVSTEVAQLKEQTLARLLDIEEAVHKALSSMSSLQSEAPTSSHPQGTTKDPSVNKVSVSSRAIQTSSSQVRDPPLVKTQEKAESHPEDKMRNHAEARGQAAVNVLPSRRLETLRGAEPGLLQVSPPCTGSSSPTFISVQSATKKLPEASSPQGSHYISGKNTHLGQDIGQALLYQRDIQDQAGTKEMCIEGAVLTGQPKNVLEFQTGSTTSKSYGAMRTVTEQYEEMDQFGNTVLTSSTTITQHADPLTDPRPQLCLHTSPMLRQLLHSPSRLNSDLAEAEITWTPCNNFHPAAQ